MHENTIKTTTKKIKKYKEATLPEDQPTTSKIDNNINNPKYKFTIITLPMYPTIKTSLYLHKTNSQHIDTTTNQSLPSTLPNLPLIPSKVPEFVISSKSTNFYQRK